MEQAQKISIAMDFIKFCTNFLKIQELPRIVFTQNKNWATNMRSFGQYQPREKAITVYIKNRNLADFLRTLAHELVHHKQNEEDRLESGSGNTGTDIENEANSLAGMIMRDYGKLNSLIYERVIKEDSRKYNVYCDIDEVFFDFEDQFDHYFGITSKEYIAERGIKSLEVAMDEVGDAFWETVKLKEGAGELWSKISDQKVTFISNLEDPKFIKEQKIKWIASKLGKKSKIALLSEAKQVGVLYYFGPYRRLARLVENDFVLTSTIQPYVSFTRNKSMTSDTIASEFRIKIDGDKLSNKYKISPFAHTSAGYGRTSKDEAEERIDLSKYPDGVDISNCILGMDIKNPLDAGNDEFDDEEAFEPPSMLAYDQLIKALKSKNIDFNIVNQFK